MQDLVGWGEISFFPQTAEGRTLGDYREIIHRGARVPLAKLNSARLAMLTAIELGYGRDCINSNVELFTLDTAIRQNELVSGEELISVNASTRSGARALDRLLFSRDLVQAFSKEFDDESLNCDHGYYQNNRHLEILDAFELSVDKF